jgi:hypothetical protein
MRAMTVGAALAVVVGLAGCGSSGVGSSATTSSVPGGSSSTTGAPTTTSSSSTSSSTTTTAAGGVSDLTITGTVRSQLVAAGAASHNLSASGFTGLAPGTTYYAYDGTTATYWAGAALTPSATTQQAQVSTQDDGSYLVFERPANGSWTAYNVGLAGTEGATCPVTVPAEVLTRWGWPPGSCRPTTIG